MGRIGEWGALVNGAPLCEFLSAVLEVPQRWAGESAAVRRHGQGVDE